MWQWFHFLLDQVPPGRSVLRLNLDETSVRFWYEPRQGLRSNSGPTRKTGCARQASRGQLRRAFTHVAIICDDASLQPYMPQVLLVNERTVTVEQSRRWTSLPGCNAQLWRAKSAWINDEVFARIIRELGKVLKSRAGDLQAILLLDAHVCHYCRRTLAACRAYDIWPVIIPARMTSLLQPLDTHVFSRFKMFFRTRLHQLMLTGANKDLTSEQVINALQHSIKGVLQRHAWTSAFDTNGFGLTFEMRPHLLEMLGWRTLPVIESGLPSFKQFAHCFPARHHIPFMQLLSGVLPPAQRGPRRPREDTDEEVILTDEVRPWKVRLRPRLFGRVVAAKAKPAPAPMPSMAAASSSGLTEPIAPMVASGGQLLPSLRRFPPGRRGSSFELV